MRPVASAEPGTGTVIPAAGSILKAILMGIPSQKNSYKNGTGRNIMPPNPRLNAT